MSATQPSLTNTFHDVWYKTTGSSASNEIASDLYSRYNEPWRTYHNWKYLKSLHDHFLFCAERLTRPELVFLAFMFHKSFWVPGNRPLSLHLSTEYAKAHLPQDVADDISPFLASLEGYRVAPDVSKNLEADVQSNIHYFLDIVNAPFGSPEETHDLNMTAQRQELMLTHLLQGDALKVNHHIREELEIHSERKYFFYTQIFRDSLGLQAHSNIAHELHKDDRATAIA